MLSLGSGLIHQAHPLHLILNLQFLGNTPATDVALHQQVIAFFCLLIDAVKVFIQRPGKSHLPIPVMVMFSKMIAAQLAPSTNRIIGSVIFNVRQIVVTMPRLIQTIIVVMNVIRQKVDLFQNGNQTNALHLQHVAESADGKKITG